MSYSLSISVPAGTSARDAIEKRVDEYRQQLSLSDDTQEALAAACGTAVALVDSGAVGDPEHFDFTVTLSGHANDGHEPREGWANDCATISVYQANRPRTVGEK